MIAIIDAYNFIHCHPAFERTLLSNLRASRDAMIRECLAWRRARGDLEVIYLVFDGSSEVFVGAPERYPGIEIVYSESGREADDVIIDILAGLRSASRKAVVVSNDNYVINNARAFGAATSSVEAFYDRMRRGGRVKTSGRAKEAKASREVPPELADEITREYKKILGID